MSADMLFDKHIATTVAVCKEESGPHRSQCLRSDPPDLADRTRRGFPNDEFGEVNSSSIDLSSKGPLFMGHARHHRPPRRFRTKRPLTSGETEAYPRSARRTRRTPHDLH